MQVKSSHCMLLNICHLLIFTQPWSFSRLGDSLKVTQQSCAEVQILSVCSSLWPVLLHSWTALSNKACQALGWPRQMRKVSQPHPDEHQATGTNDLRHSPDVATSRGSTLAVSAQPEARGNTFQDRMYLQSCPQELSRSLNTSTLSNRYWNTTEVSVLLKLHFL